LKLPKQKTRGKSESPRKKQDTDRSIRRKRDSFSPQTTKHGGLEKGRRSLSAQWLEIDRRHLEESSRRTQILGMSRNTSRNVTPANSPRDPVSEYNAEQSSLSETAERRRPLILREKEKDKEKDISMSPPDGSRPQFRLFPNYKYPSNKQTKQTSTSDKDRVDVAELKFFYKIMQNHDAVKYLKEMIMSETTREPHVLAYILWKSLVSWNAFSFNTYNAILELCSDAIHTFQYSKAMQLEWLGTSLTLVFLAEEERKKITDELTLDRIQDFINHVHEFSSIIFERIITTVIERLDKKTILEYIFSHRTTKQFILETFQLTDTVKTIFNHAYWNGIKVQFLNRLMFHFVTTVLDGLFRTSCTYTVGIKVSLLHSEIDYWLNEHYHEYYNTVLEGLQPMQQAGKILLLPRKSDLLQNDLRENIAPYIRPTHIGAILYDYHSDEFSPEESPVTTELIETISHQDSTYTITSHTYDPNKEPTPLHFNFPMEHIDLETVVLPKVILDKPAFSFLLRKSNPKIKPNNQAW